MASEASPFHIVGSNLRVELRVQPGASRTAVDGAGKLADGGIVLMVRVGAPAEGGKANAALVKLLAKAWRLPKGAFTLVSGHSARRKSLEIAGDPEALLADLQAWLTENSEPGIS